MAAAAANTRKYPTISCCRFDSSSGGPYLNTQAAMEAHTTHSCELLSRHMPHYSLMVAFKALSDCARMLETIMMLMNIMTITGFETLYRCSSQEHYSHMGSSRGSEEVSGHGTPFMANMYIFIVSIVALLWHVKNVYMRS